MTDRFALKAEGVSAVVKAEGAELVSLKDAGGDELLWQAGPEWPRHGRFRERPDFPTARGR